MYHAQDQDAHLGVLEAVDPKPAAVAVRKEGEGVARNLVKDGIAAAAEQGHRGPIGERAHVREDDRRRPRATCPGSVPWRALCAWSPRKAGRDRHR